MCAYFVDVSALEDVISKKGQGDVRMDRRVCQLVRRVGVEVCVYMLG